MHLKNDEDVVIDEASIGVVIWSFNWAESTREISNNMSLVFRSQITISQ